jgi:hypothetical protein
MQHVAENAAVLRDMHAGRPVLAYPVQGWFY